MAIETVDPTDTLAVLKAAEEWLKDPEHWTTGTFWRDAQRRPLDWCSPLDTARERVAATCADGALGLVDGTPRDDPRLCSRQEPRDALRVALGMAIPAANDNFADGYPRVMAGLRKAIEKIETAV